MDKTTVTSAMPKTAEHPAKQEKPMLVGFAKLLVLQRHFNRPRGHKCLMA